MAGSAQSSNGDPTESFAWSIAVRRPSRVAPSDRRCSCSSRCPLEVNICGRVSISRTGRPTSRAASAARVTPGHTIAFIPNEPPTNGARTRTCASGSPSRWATVSWVARTPIVDSWIVSRSPSHSASVDGASIGL